MGPEAAASSDFACSSAAITLSTSACISPRTIFHHMTKSARSDHAGYLNVAGWEVDAVWEKHRLVVEVDGYRYHRSRAKFERDRRKDADLMLAGYRVLRITWHRLVKERKGVIALLSSALST